jgi:hypothetical protein
VIALAKLSFDERESTGLSRTEIAITLIAFDEGAVAETFRADIARYLRLPV